MAPIQTQQSVAGFVASDPQLSYTARGDARLYMKVGVEHYRREENNSFTKLETTFHDLVAYKAAAEHGYQQLAKGDNLIASGVVEKNLLELFPRCKWNCRIDADGIYHESDAFCNALKSDDASLVTKTLLYITFHHPNDRWVQDICLLLLDNENADIKGLAITCLGHLARIHKRLDTKKVFAILEDKKDDEALKGRIEDAIEDITLFVGT